ncbi:DUF1993 domain-containing protein [Chiayiivirga flava]|uniref:DUF1993 domain-containing protein n=1 Tax=Chiayiivirga flava TaxID=659595 RepID=A0A7W8D5K2_9GAMM|nr:DUF1993 domain-containing protein [Chiayiivirga flava]MBB5208316.1 hypothetical protein [Chiayiivirga flava]
MTVSISRLTVPAYTRGLRVLSRYLDKAIEFSAANPSAPALIDARLAPDMLTLAGQVQRASDTSKLAIARLLGSEAPKFDDNETTLEQLRDRVAKTLAYIETADSAALDAAATREINLTFGPTKHTFAGEDFVTTFALPNFYFHLAIAHGILRHAGVAIGKLDYLGAAG